MSIRIEIGDKWVVTSDQYQFILSERKVARGGKMAGKEWLDTLGYYPRIDQLISGLIHHHIRQSSATTFDELVAEIERVGRLCSDALTSSYCEKYFSKNA